MIVGTWKPKSHQIHFLPSSTMGPDQKKGVSEVMPQIYEIIVFLVGRFLLLSDPFYEILKA